MPSRASTSLLQKMEDGDKKKKAVSVNALTGFNLIATLVSDSDKNGRFFGVNALTGFNLIATNRFREAHVS